MKSGANFVDRNRIKELAKAGKKAPAISKSLGIEESCVKAFMPKVVRKTKKAETLPPPSFE